MIRSFVLLTWLLLIAGCGASEPSTVTLPTQGAIPYRVILKTFRDGDYADQPFHLLLKAERGNAEPRTILRAAQCKEVNVGQTPDTLFVFYRELALTSFASFQYDDNEPRIMLCDLHSPLCQSAHQELIRQGVNLAPVCTYQSPAEQ